MERFIFCFCSIHIMLMHAEAACWIGLGDGPNCQHDGDNLDPGQTYNVVTASRCYKCVCSEDGMFSCCDIGVRIVNYPDTCKIVRRGCTEVAVSKINENEPCQSDMLAAVG